MTNDYRNEHHLYAEWEKYDGSFEKSKWYTNQGMDNNVDECIKGWKQETFYYEFRIYL